MKVLVLGGTGAMGVHIVNFLVRNGVETTVTSRRKKQSEGMLTYLQGNAHDIGFLNKVLKSNWDTIIDFMIYSTYEFEERVELFLNRTSQYIFLSSSRVYSESERLINERTNRLLDTSKDEEFLSTDEYALAKARQEDILIQSGKSNWTIIRPYITYSENRLQLGVLEKEEWLYRALHGRSIVLPIDIHSKMTTMTYGYDVAKGMIAIIGINDALGEIFNITTHEEIKWSNVLKIYLDVLEKHMKIRPKIKLVNIDDFLTLRTAKYQLLYDRLFDRKFCNDKISQYVDVDNFSSIERGLQQNLCSFLRNKEFNKISWRSEAIKDRLTKERTPLNEIVGMKEKLKYILFRYLRYQSIRRS